MQQSKRMAAARIILAHPKVHIFDKHRPVLAETEGRGRTLCLPAVSRTARTQRRDSVADKTAPSLRASARRRRRTRATRYYGVTVRRAPAADQTLSARPAPGRRTVNTEPLPISLATV